MSHSLFTSESVSNGHPDKIADQISDAILDACLAGDPSARVACETMVTQGLVILSGEITTSACVDYQKIARSTILEIGYDNPSLGFDGRSCGVICAINQQSPEIAQAINAGAGDQGIMFGYACDETPELMPMPIMLAHHIVQSLRLKRENGILKYLRPDAKSQVTVEYNEDLTPARVHTIVVSAQHSENISEKILTGDLKELIKDAIPAGLIDEHTLFYINPAGRFVLGGPSADCGLTGRKIIVDTYGGMGRHGGGAFSGKDPSKIDRSGSYAARYIAKNIVAAKLAKRCEIQLSYAIGIPHPVSIHLDTFGTHTVNQDLLLSLIPQVFSLSPSGIIQMLDLRRPIYRKTSFEGHFGKSGMTWEKTDRVEELAGRAAE